MTHDALATVTPTEYFNAQDLRMIVVFSAVAVVLIHLVCYQQKRKKTSQQQTSQAAKRFKSQQPGHQQDDQTLDGANDHVGNEVATQINRWRNGGHLNAFQ